ncbi:hypothetical protein JCGZ_26745 [Jatropha curcas]|uniref:Uncharacterized protein n=1 Tax=Jatropha curcas TaxID=180498 RepID=A0A067L006_JATCU|nr:hypothetical protein JCGZ_26745 [Jatropha curcas]
MARTGGSNRTENRRFLPVPIGLWNRWFAVPIILEPKISDSDRFRFPPVPVQIQFEPPVLVLGTVIWSPLVLGFGDYMLSAWRKFPFVIDLKPVIQFQFRIIFSKKTKMEKLKEILKQAEEFWAILKMKMAARRALRCIPQKPEWVFSYSMLDKFARVLAIAISQHVDPEFRNADLKLKLKLVLLISS